MEPPARQTLTTGKQKAPSVFAVPRGLLVSCFVRPNVLTVKLRIFIIRWRAGKVKSASAQKGPLCEGAVAERLGECGEVSP
mgnify:FL=1